jgi:hypothetical protein
MPLKSVLYVILYFLPLVSIPFCLNIISKPPVTVRVATSVSACFAAPPAPAVHLSLGSTCFIDTSEYVALLPSLGEMYKRVVEGALKYKGLVPLATSEKLLS